VSEQNKRDAEEAPSILCRVVTPQKKVFEGKVAALEFEAPLGMLEIFPRHDALMTPLSIGLMTLTPPGDADPVKFAVHGGFLDFANDEANVVADVAERAEEIDLLRAAEAEKRAKAMLAEASRMGKDAGIDFDRAQLALMRSMARQRAARTELGAMAAGK
jgi:F-type H+-transporting ATPase subunit epsilon